jgi:hypothetical protein
MKQLTPAIFFYKIKKRQPFLSLLKTAKCLGFFVLFLLEMAVSYRLSLLLFHVLIKPIRKPK